MAKQQAVLQIEGCLICDLFDEKALTLQNALPCLTICVTYRHDGLDKMIQGLSINPWVLWNKVRNRQNVTLNSQH